MDPAVRNGKTRRGAFPETVDAFKGGAPQIADARPYTEDFIGRATGVPDFDLEGLRALVVTYRASFSDYTIRCDDILDTEDAVIVRWQSSGRFTAPFMEAIPTGEELVTTGITIYRFREGRIAENWTEYDSLPLMSALGALVRSS